MIELKTPDIRICIARQVGLAVSQKVDLIEENQCDIWTQNTKISLNQLRNP